jgi:Ni/Fe-hydrogenase subunit HybB-like protein
MIAEVRPLGPLAINRSIKVLGVVAFAGALAIVWRIAAGLGASTALNDGYPWGLWIAFDVVTGTALACGGYGIALLVYIFNKGEYHPLVRPAIVASALGYTLAAVSVALDIGRPWMIWKVPLFFWHWNLDSALLEVALCISTYVLVLWVELSPSMFQRWRGERAWPFHNAAQRIAPVVDRGLPWIIALGVLLPTLHQSSLGTLMMLSGPRLHPLWQTWLLPFLFLISCLAMGFAVVVLESMLSHYLLGRKIETAMLARLARVIVPLQGAYLTLRLYDLLVRNELALALVPSGYAALFWLELVLFAIPAVMLASRERARQAGTLFRAAALLAIAGSLYRFDTFLVAFQPGAHWSYFPSLGEMTVTAGLVSMEILAYIAIIHYFPILTGAPGSTEKAGTAWART